MTALLTKHSSTVLTLTGQVLAALATPAPGYPPVDMDLDRDTCAFGAGVQALMQATLVQATSAPEQIVREATDPIVPPQTDPGLPDTGLALKFGSERGRRTCLWMGYEGGLPNLRLYLSTEGHWMMHLTAHSPTVNGFICQVNNGPSKAVYVHKLIVMIVGEINQLLARPIE